MFPKPSQWQGSSMAAQRHSKQPGSEGLPWGVSKGHRNQEQCSHESKGHGLDPHKLWANNSITHIYLQVIPDYLWACCRKNCRPQHGTQLRCTAQVPVCLLHFGLCFCRTQLPQAGRPGFPMQEKKERLLPSLQFTLQLEGCLQNSILPQPLPITTRVKRIYITKLPPSFIFILFITYSNFTYLLQPRNCPRHYACLSLCVQHCAQILSFHMNSS